MAYKITKECISCGACETECPNKAISEKGATFVIDPERCTQCVGTGKEPQCAAVCPVQAPVPDEARKETRDELLAKWRKLHPGETPKA